VLVFSGFLADHPSVRATPDTVRGTAIWWGHGTADTMMPFRHGEAGWAALEAAGATLRKLAVEGLGHSISREEAADAAAFLREHVVEG
jgi:phospholipase/carboxylesterase